MKKYWMAALLGSMMVLGACSSEDAQEETDNTAEAEEAPETETAEENEEAAEGSETEEAEEAEESSDEAADEAVETEETSSEDSSSSAVVEVDTDGALEEEYTEENEEQKVTFVYQDTEVGHTGEVGPIEFSIDAVELVSIEIKDEMMAAQWEREVGDEIHAFAIAMGFENTVDQDLDFFVPGIKAITNTKEQLQTDYSMSEHPDTQFLGQVAHDGVLVYVLEKSTVQELETIELRIPTASDADYVEYGEEQRVKLLINQ
ncbi:hypothetical protein P6709_11105 [Jeotgalibacillus sp. ET6]|uniref:hypothetical protein n=1 Tax=Jeotgalibacillus sp. ET6 TaxID=3037260 RepID=UPI0024188139|nr:hypothetical protein [Jeotgalibacillus sp. ET6]MDG5472303.1 hypothetical protein [Jeotgalibacillus sp. ET6]